MNNLSLFYNILIIGVLLFFSFFFSGSETAFSALTRAQVQRLRKSRKKASSYIVNFYDDPKRLFITVLFGNTLVNMAFVSITGSLIYNSLFLGKRAGLAYLVAIIVQTSILLVIGEITPKTYAVIKSEKFSYSVARPLWFFSTLILPFRKFLTLLTDFFLSLFGVKSLSTLRSLTKEELRELVKITEKHGILEKSEEEIIHSIFELQEIKAKEIMIPRPKMVCIEVSKTIEEALKLTKNVGYSRLPVYRGKIDNICGVFYVKDLPRWKGLRIDELGKRLIQELTIEEFLYHRSLLETLNPRHKNTLIRQPFFAYKTKKIGPLMLEMMREKQQMAILLDEYGGVSGLVTMEDIVEEVLGEIIDEYDIVLEQTITRHPEDHSSFLIPGFATLRSVERRLGVKLDESLADTMAGYVVNVLGSIPKVGDVIYDEKSNAEFEILRMDGPRISQIRLKPLRKKKHKQENSKNSLIFIFILLSLLSLGSSKGEFLASPNLFIIVAFSGMLLLSILLIAFFAGSETAVISSSKAWIEVQAQKEDKRAQIIKGLIQKPDRFLGIVLVGTNLTSTAAGVAGLKLAQFIFPGKENVQELVNTLAMTFIILIFGEILPKTIFRARAEDLALWSASGLKNSARVLSPIASSLTKITNIFVRAAGGEEDSRKINAKREELKLLATMGEKEGAIEKGELHMIRSVLELESKTIENVMTPLVDVVALPKETSIDELYKKVSEFGFSRIPVYEGRIDNIIGVINILDVLYAEQKARDISPFIRYDISHEPKSKRVFTLLKEIKQKRNPMVFVVDEYGGIVGLVTREDLIEEIVGEIRDEKDREERIEIQEINKNIIECNGKTEVERIKILYDISIPQGDYTTIGGYLIYALEKIPQPGESIETAEFKITVLEADARSVRRVRIFKK